MEDGFGGGQHFMAMEDGEDSVAGPSQCRFFGGVKCRNEC